MDYRTGFKDALSVADLPLHWGDSPSFQILAVTEGRRIAAETSFPSGCSEEEALALLGSDWVEFGIDCPKKVGIALVRAGLDPDSAEARKCVSFGYLQVFRRLSEDVPGADASWVSRFHAKSNRRKALAYWMGFLRGVLASESVEELEVPPLVVEARNFLNLFGRDESRFLIGDLAYLQADERRRAFDLINDIIERRAGEGLLGSPADNINEFYGFCAGIACDNRITVREVRKLLARVTPELRQDTRVRSLERAILLAIEDGQITPEESLDICEWIARLVGDSASDTGLPTYGSAAVMYGALTDPSRVVFRGRTFVLTGKFEIGPRKAVAAMIVQRGGEWANSVTQKTDYLAVAGAPSPDWKFSHAGNKIRYAEELRQHGGRPELVPEGVLARALDL